MGGRGRLVAPLAIAAGIAVAWLMTTNDVRTADGADVALVLAVGWSFTASGVIAWRLRPANPIGPVMIATGFLRFVAALGWSQDPLLYAIGRSLEPFYLIGFVYLLLVFPSGRLESRLDRWVFGTLFMAAGPLHTAWYLFGGLHDQACSACPSYLFEVADVEVVARTFYVAHEVLGIVAGLLALGIVIHRWRRASPPLRFAIAPIVWVGMATWAVGLFWLVSGLFFPTEGRGPERTMELMLALVAVAFLAGLARTRLARVGVAELVIGLGESPAPGELRTALGRALHDPSLEVAYWLAEEERFVDAQGRAVEPTASDGRAVTMVERDGRRIAALVHDPAALDDGQLVDSVTAAAALQLENERLQAELRAQLEEVEASRARIVEAAQEERRRIERDLHDGTQQRLVSVAMTLGRAGSRLSSDPAGAASLVDEAKGQLSDALQELRELSQGIHPGILTERGLPAAVAELTRRVGLPVALDVSLTGRLPERVEEAAYFMLSEALTNVVKHANAAHVRVEVDCVDGVAVMRVSDDGRGGADPSRGSGIRGLRDRVEALGGRLNVSSTDGVGTTVEAEIPCA